MRFREINHGLNERFSFWLNWNHTVAHVIYSNGVFQAQSCLNVLCVCVTMSVRWLGLLLPMDISAGDGDLLLCKTLEAGFDIRLLLNPLTSSLSSSDSLSSSTMPMGVCMVSLLRLGWSNDAPIPFFFTRAGDDAGRESVLVEWRPTPPLSLSLLSLRVELRLCLFAFSFAISSLYDDMVNYTHNTPNWDFPKTSI